MPDLPCNLRQEVSAYMGQTEVEFRTDVLLPQPYLLGPRDQAVICLKSTPFGPSNIALSWASIAGATLYVVQWGTNPQMQGAGVRQVITASTAVALTRDVQIRIGETYHWRVFALNISGGVSPPSETRQFTFNCPEGTDPSTESDLFNVDAEIVGPSTIRSCEDTAYYVKLSFTEKDANERTICTFEGCEWESELLEGGGTILTPVIALNPLFTIANVDTPTQSNAIIKATLTFTNEITNEEFTKDVSIEVLAEPFAYGCGLICVEECTDENDPGITTKKVGIDFASIAGEGLEVFDPNDLPPEDPDYDPCACPRLDVAMGCGLIEKPFCVEGGDPVNKMAVDVEALAGVGLTVDCNKDECECDKFAIDLRDRFGSTYTVVDPSLPGEDTGLTLGAFKQSVTDVTTFFSPDTVVVQSGVASSHEIILSLFHRDKDEPDFVRFQLQLPPYGVNSNLGFQLIGYYREGGWEYLGKPPPGLWFTIVAESQGDIVLSGGTLTNGKRWQQVAYGSSSIDETLKEILHTVSAPTTACANNRVIYTVYVSTSPAVPDPIVPSASFAKVLEVTADYVRNRDVSVHTRDSSYFFNSVYKPSEYDVNLEPMSITSRYNTTYDLRLRDFESPTKTQLVAGAKHAGSTIGGYTLVALTGDTIANQTALNNVSRTITRTLIPLGCNLEAQYLNPDQESLGDFGFRRIQVNVGALAGDGLKETDLTPPEDSYDPFGCTKLEVNYGCGLKLEPEYPEPPSGPRQALAVDLDQIAGTGLEVVPGAGPGDCPTLAVIPGSTEFASGCGIDIIESVISIDYGDIADEGSYTWSDASCPPTVLFDGCSTGSGLASTEGVAQAQGLVYYQAVFEGCPYLFTKVNIPYNCTLGVDSGNLGVELDIFGKGLKVTDGEDLCPIVELCVEDLSSPIEVSTASEGGVDLDISGEDVAIAWGQVYYEEPNPPNPASCGQLVTKTVIPIGCGLTASGGLLNLDIANFETVTPTNTMFVLGYDPNREGCKFVKFAITECPE